MTYEAEFKSMAAELTEEFSSEFGRGKIEHVVQDYDVDTGKVETIEVVDTPFIVFTDISADEVNDKAFINTHAKVLIAGIELNREPVKGALVTNPKTGKKHTVVDVYVDQYGAAYRLYVRRKHV